MKLLTWITESFIATFGITRPKPEQERLASVLIGGFLLAACGGVLAIMAFMIFEIMTGSHGR